MRCLKCLHAQADLNLKIQMNDRIYVRVTKQEKKEIMDFSSESGYSILELIRIGIEKIRSQKK